MLRARLADVVLSVVCVVAGEIELRGPWGGDGITAGPVWLDTLLALVFGACLVGWRLAPGATLVAMAATVFLPSLVVAHDGYFWTTILPLMLVTYRSARSGDDLLARWGLLLPMVAMDSVSFRHGDDLVSNVAALLAFFAGPHLVGRLVRRNEQQRDRLDAALAELAGEQSRREQVAAQTERNRIATEMHDVVAHAVSEMVLQVGAARMGLQSADLAVPSQLTAAETTGREALADLRRSLGLLPEHPDHGLAPVPGLSDVDALVAPFRDAGLDVRLAPVDPALARLPTGLQLSVHRVLQETLTNALKHAGRVRVDVTLRAVDGAVDLDLVDAGPGRRAGSLPSGGNGLVGVRERVAVYGGSLEAGPSGRGWRVHARWPWPTGVPA